MAVLFPSTEWVEDLTERVNEDPEFAAKFKLDGAELVLNFESEKGLLEDDFIIWIKIDEGKIQEYKILNSLDGVDATFKVRGKYSVWKKIVIGKLSPTMALVSQRVKLAGNMKELLKNKKGFDVVLKHFGSVDVIFAG